MNKREANSSYIKSISYSRLPVNRTKDRFFIFKLETNLCEERGQLGDDLNLAKTRYAELKARSEASR